MSPKKPSLRKSINEHCAECVFDSRAPGTRLQQITLCTVEKCHLWKVRPKTARTIPKSVLSCHRGVKDTFEPLDRLSDGGSESVGRIASDGGANHV